MSNLIFSGPRTYEKAQNGIKVKSSQSETQTTKTITSKPNKRYNESRKMSFIKVETLGIEDDTNDESRSTEDNDPYLQSLVAHTFDQGSIPHRKGKGKESSEGEDPLNGLEIVNEGCFELPMELTENGLEVLKDAEVTMKTTIPPSRKF